MKKWLASLLIAALGVLAADYGFRGLAAEIAAYQGRQAVSAKDLTAALAAYNRAVDLMPQRAAYHRDLGNVRHLWFAEHPGSFGAAQRGEEDFAVANTLDPLYPYYWADRGRLALTMENNIVAPSIGSIACFEHAIKLDPWNIFILDALISDLIEKGRRAEADPYIPRLLSVRPQLTRSLASHWIKSDEDMNKFLLLLGRNPEALYEYALWLVRRDRKPLAVTVLQTVLKLTNREGRQAIYAAYALIAAGEPETAVQTLAAMVSKAPGNIGARWYWAEALRVAGKCDEALKAYQDILNQGPADDCLPYQGMARCAVVKKDLRAAQADYFKVIRCPSLSRQYRFEAAMELARVMANAGDHALELAALREALPLTNDAKAIRKRIRELEKTP